MVFLKLTIVFSFLLQSLTITAQPLQFERLSKHEGLPDKHILALHHDSQGFFWIGTTDGLFKYDGRKSIEFRYDSNDSTSISNNTIRHIIEDKKGNIWIATKRGLNRYSPETESFKRYFFQGGKLFEAENYIHSLVEDKNGKIWYGTYNGLFQLDEANDDIVQFLPQAENQNSLTHKLVWEIFEDQKGHLWFGTGNGVTRYKNDGSYQFEQFFPEPENPNGLKTGRVWEFVQQPNGTLWMGTNDGFYRVHQVEETLFFQRFGHEPDNPNSLSHNFIESMFLEENRLWVATWQGGLNEVLLPKTKSGAPQFIHHKHDPNNEYSISSNLVEKVYRDQAGVLWAGTSSGLNRIAPAAKKFKSISHIPENPNSLSANIVKSVLQDSYGNYWIGTRNGLNFLTKENFEKEHFEFQVFKNDPNNILSISHNNIFGLYEDSKKTLWISTYNGLNYINLDQKDGIPEFRYFKRADGLPHSFIYNIAEIEDNQYWVTTYGQLSKMTFDKEAPEETIFYNYDMDDEKENALVNATTYKVCKDKFGQFWIATFDGLSIYKDDGSFGFFDNYKNVIGDTTSLSDNSISTLFLDSQERLWIGTRSGLNLVVQEAVDDRATFRCFGIRDGFPNDVVQAIEEDDKGRLWVGTNDGLSLFDPDAVLAGQKGVLRNYVQEDGLAGQGIVFRSSFKGKDGNLFFGTAGGLNYFNPSQLTDNQKIPKVVFTKLKVLNEEVKPSSNKKAILKKSISQTKQLVFNHRQNVVTIEFVALDFTRPEKNQYAYQLEGFDPKWINIGNENSVTYTNLPSGDYTLKVKGSNNDGIWNEVPTQLSISVLPPPWETWWAYLIYSLFIAGALYAFMKYRIQQKVNELEKRVAIERARFEEREILRKKNAADFHDELGHRLTKISLFLELAERQIENGTPIRQYLSKIKHNASELSGGIRDLIWTLDPKKDSLYQTLIRLQEFGDQLFDYSEIHFKTLGISQNLGDIKLEPDERKHLLLIFKEAMNNCLKYSGAKNADLEVTNHNGLLQIIFKDDGIGFDVESVSKGYGLKNMEHRASKVEGNLEISSKNGDGTIICLSFSKTKIPHMG